MNSSPLARRIRLGRYIRDRREQHKLTHTTLGAKSRVSATVISRMENPESNITRKPNFVSVRRILDALDVPRGSDERAEVEQYAEDAADDGWWESGTYARMGNAQKTAAIVEFGAATVDEYAAHLLPGLVQTPEYARHRALVRSTDEPTGDADAIVAGRLRRQQQLVDAGTRYHLVIEEQAIRRYPVPPTIMLDQLQHLLDLAEQPNVSIRVLRVNAQTGDGPVARSPFAHLIYSDPGDPQIVTVDTVTAFLLITGDDEVRGYARLYQRLCDAALSDADSAALIRSEANSLAATI